MSLEFNSEEEMEVTVACRLGHWSGIATGTMWCDDIRIELVEQEDGGDGDVTSPTELAIRTLSRDKGIRIAEINVISAEKVDFSNGCLGCAKPGEFCSQVMTSGFIIILRHEQLGPYGGTIYEYEYHIGDRNNSISLCREDQKDIKS